MNVLMKVMEIKNNKRCLLRHYEESYGITLLKHQLELIKSKDKVIERKFARQAGGTTALLIKAIEFAINNDNSNIMFLSNSTAQANRFLELTMGFIGERNISKCILKARKNPHYIRFKNGSAINFISYRTIDNTRGRKIDCLIIDGKRYIPDHLLNSVYACALYSENSQIVILN